VIFAVPADIPVTVVFAPPVVTLATVVSLLTHAPLVVLLRSVVRPIQAVLYPVIAAGAALIVTVFVLVHDPPTA
jgi:hypothetical protein